MKLLLLAAFVALTAAAPRLHPPVPAIITVKDSYIVGGSEASIGQFPFQGSLLSSTGSGGSHTCGAVYIGQRWAICAAHCTESR